MQADATTTFASLVGERVLTGVDFEIKQLPNNDKANLMRFVLDGVIWEAVEDPEDDYRSSLDVLEKSCVPVQNTFPPCKLRMELFTGDKHDKAECIRGYDVVTGGLVLEVGTRNTDDYYPWYSAVFDPKAMAINAGKE